MHTFIHIFYPKQWKHVAGNENPTDIISRGCNPNDFKINQWFTGPDFLCKPDFESEATDVIPDISDDDPEVKRQCDVISHLGQVTTINDHHPLKLLVDHYSSWHKLRRGLSWL